MVCSTTEGRLLLNVAKASLIAVTLAGGEGGTVGMAQ